MTLVMLLSLLPAPAFADGGHTPTSDDFAFAAPYDCIYDGNAKVADVVSNAPAMGEFTVKYSMPRRNT